MSTEIDLYEKKYPAKWVVMQNTITHAFREMSINEKRLILLASSTVRLSEATEKTPIDILASDFANFACIDNNSSYKLMKAASKRLMKRSFVYNDKSDIETEVQWVIRSKYQDGRVTVFFTDEVIELLSLFDSLHPYTKYLKQDILRLQLTYSIDLYHLAKKHQKMGGFTMSLDEYRKELGTPESYQRINNLKKYAVDSPIDEINKKTDIKITYENVKRGRTVTALKFTVKAKPQLKPKLESNDGKKEKTVADLSDKQIEALVCTQAFKNDYNHMISASSPINTDYKLWKPEMSKRLKANPEDFNKRPIQYYLDQIGDYKKEK